MALQINKRNEEDEFDDNIIGWFDAINRKLDKIRAVKANYSILEEEDTLIGIMPIDESSETLLEQLPHEKKRIAEGYSLFPETALEHRKQEWLAARVLLKEMLGSEKEIVYSSTGKPFTADNSYNINISHTKGFVAVIADRKKRVAIDIEYISDRVKRIRSKFLSAKEEQAVEQSDSINLLLLHWTAKETMFKILDKEIVDFKEHLHVEPFQIEAKLQGTFNAYETRTESNEHFVIRYMITDNFVATWTIQL